jgi:hypothetical protein
LPETKTSHVDSSLEEKSGTARPQKQEHVTLPVTVLTGFFGLLPLAGRILSRVSGEKSLSDEHNLKREDAT